MTTGTQAWTEQTVEAAGVQLQMVTGGSGAPLLILHDEFGHHGQLRYHEALARDFSLCIPAHPGFGSTERLEWVMNMRDLAGWYLEALDDLDLGPVNLMGFSLGGWLAAEMASMSPDLFQKLVLVAPAGIRPPTGEIFDLFLVVSEDFLTVGFHDPEATPEYRQVCPEEALRGACRSLGGGAGRGLPPQLAALHALPGPPSPGPPPEAGAHPDHLGAAGQYRPGVRRTGLPRVHPRLTPRTAGLLRPSSRVGKDGRIRDPGQGVSIVLALHALW